MTTERWRRVKAILEEAQELDVNERSAFLDRACGADHNLRHEAEALLTAGHDIGGFLSSPLAELAASAGLSETSAFTSGLRIGAYQILHPVGRGGMGTVYLAQRA